MSVIELPHPLPSGGEQAHVRAARRDLAEGIAAYHVWGGLGWHDIRQRYRRSILGPFWFTLTTAIMVTVLGSLYSQLLRVEISSYLPYLACGLVVWQYIAGILNESCAVFSSSGALIKQVNVPLSIHVCRMVWRNFLILVHSLPVLLLALVVLGRPLGFELLVLPLSFALLLLNGVWVGACLGILCARFRDIPPIISNLVQVAFFFTPVMWSLDILAGRAWVAHYNPFFHLIELVRGPILGKLPDFVSWACAAGLCIVGFAFAQLLMRRFRARVPYWL